MTESDGPDLVVAGAGGGLVGALRAASLGLDVLVVEKNEHFARGNNTAMSTAMIPGAGTRWQRDAGIDDSPEVFLADIKAKTHGEADERLAAALAEVSGRLVEWLAEEVSVPLSLVTDFRYPGHSRLRCHTVPTRAGETLLRDILRQVRRSSSIDLMVPATLTDVVARDGFVEAVVVSSPAGQETIPTKALLLATNGFAADQELVRRHIPEIAGARYHGSEGSTGDALRIGAKLGAATAFLDAYQGHAALSAQASTLVGWATVMHGGFLVDRAGRRFGDETTGYSEYAAEVLRKTGGKAWIVFDERIHHACLAFQDYRDTLESGVVRRGDTIQEAARAGGIDPSVLAHTLAQARAYAEGSAEDEHGREDWEAPLAPPFYVVEVVPALFHTQGGLVVDSGACVLADSGHRIPGLYASGGAAAGISGHGSGGYLAGNGLLPALGLAFLAAEDIASRTGWGFVRHQGLEPRTR